jgi:hypothetical protein
VDHHRLRVPAIDITPLASPLAFARTLKQRGIALLLAELRDDVTDFLRSRDAEVSDQSWRIELSASG